MESNIHFNVTNNTDEDLRDLNLYLVVEQLEEGQNDMVTIAAGESFLLHGYSPAFEGSQGRMKAAIEAAGGTWGWPGEEDVVSFEIVVEGE